MRLKCPGVGRDKDNEQSLCFYFNRKVSDDEMRYLHEVIQRASECSPIEDRSTTPRLKLVGISVERNMERPLGHAITDAEALAVARGLGGEAK